MNLSPFLQSKQPIKQVQRNHQQNYSSAGEACPTLTPPFLKYLFFIGAAYLSPLREAFVIRFISLDPHSCSPRSISSAATYIIIFLSLQKCHQKSCKISGSICAVWCCVFTLTDICLISSLPPLLSYPCNPSQSHHYLPQILTKRNEISVLC